MWDWPHAKRMNSECAPNEGDKEQDGFAGALLKETKETAL
jgi:hypothetical protein